MFLNGLKEIGTYLGVPPWLVKILLEDCFLPAWQYRSRGRYHSATGVLDIWRNEVGPGIRPLTREEFMRGVLPEGRDIPTRAEMEEAQRMVASCMFPPPNARPTIH